MTFPKNRARFAALAALGVAAAAIVPATAFAAPGDPVADGCFGFDTSTGTITGYNDTGTGNAPCSLDITIPSTIGGTPVAAIGNNAFSGIALDSITVPDTVTTIGQYAFSNTGADTVKIGAGVKNIGAGAFSHNDLTSVEIPASVSTLGGDAFAYNPLTSVSIDGDNLNVPTSAFNATDGLTITDVTIGYGVRTLAPSVFSGQPVSKLTIAEGVTSIGAFAFNGNRLTDLRIPSSVKDVQANAFDNGLIRTVTVGAGVQSIDDSAFLRNHIESVTFEGNTAFNAELFAQNFTTDELQETLSSYPTPAEGIAALNAKATMVKVYSTNADFIAAHGTGKVVDMSGVGAFNYGYIVNPAAYTVASKDSAGASLATPARVTGTNLADHLVATALTAGLDAFHQIGDTVSVEPATITGFTSPAAQEVKLTRAENDVTFTYGGVTTPTEPGQGSDDEPGQGSDDEPGQGTGEQPGLDDIPYETPPGETSAASGDASLVKTGGFDATALSIGAAITMLLGAGVLVALRRRRTNAAE